MGRRKFPFDHSNFVKKRKKLTKSIAKLEGQQSSKVEDLKRPKQLIADRDNVGTFIVFKNSTERKLFKFTTRCEIKEIEEFEGNTNKNSEEETDRDCEEETDRDCYADDESNKGFFGTIKKWLPEGRVRDFAENNPGWFTGGAAIAGLALAGGAVALGSHCISGNEGQDEGNNKGYKGSSSNTAALTTMENVTKFVEEHPNKVKAAAGLTSLAAIGAMYTGYKALDQLKNRSAPDSKSNTDGTVSARKVEPKKSRTTTSSKPPSSKKWIFITLPIIALLLFLAYFFLCSSETKVDEELDLELGQGGRDVAE